MTTPNDDSGRFSEPITAYQINPATGGVIGISDPEARERAQERVDAWRVFWEQGDRLPLVRLGILRL